MCARPLADRKKTESPNFRMTKGDVAMLMMKASVEGVSMSELVRRSVEAYEPTPRSEICVECNREMSYSTTDWELPLEIGDQKHIIVITHVPVMKCVCGEVSYSLDVEISVNEFVDQLVLDALRHQKNVPEIMTIEELFKGGYAGN